MDLVLQDVLDACDRHLSAEGASLETVDSGSESDLALAAASYAMNAAGFTPGRTPIIWPWHRDWWNPTGPREDLVRAAAFLLIAISQRDKRQSACPSGDFHST